jgi:CheY-like chemotaxis protein
MQQSPKILLIDDNSHGLIARRTLLEEARYHVETAKDGEAGLKRFAAEAFDVVVTYFPMPQARGIEMLQQVRQAAPRVPVVVLSGYVKSLGLTEESTGADAVLSKGPTETQDLLRAVARVLRKKKPASQRARSARGKHSSSSR